MIQERATIIGGKGFIGSSLIRYLQELGWDCWAPERMVQWPLAGKRLGHVFYCAGLTSDFLRRPADAVEAHVSLLSRILQSDHYESLLYLSSARIYDGRNGVNAGSEAGPFALSPENPRHLYDLTKLTGEALCMAMSNGKARVARLSCVYRDGSDPDGFMGQVLRKVEQAKTGDIIEIDSSPSFMRDYVYIDDVLKAMVAIALHGAHSIYNVASGVNFSNLELGDVIEDTTGRRLRFLSNMPSPPTAVIDITRMTNGLKLIPLIPSERLRAWATDLPAVLS